MLFSHLRDPSVDFIAFLIIYWWQEIRYNAVLPVVNCAVPLLLLSLVVLIINVHPKASSLKEHLPRVVLEVPILISLHLFLQGSVEPIERGVVALADLGRLLKPSFLQIDETPQGRIVYLLLSAKLIIFINSFQATQRHEPAYLVTFLQGRGRLGVCRISRKLWREYPMRVLGI